MLMKSLCQLRPWRLPDSARLSIRVLVVALTLTGCATQTYTIAGGGGAEPTQEDMQHFFVSGLGQENTMNASEICGGIENVARVESHQRFLDGLLGALTYGIYTPRVARVYCVEPAEDAIAAQ